MTTRKGFVAVLIVATAAFAGCGGGGGGSSTPVTVTISANANSVQTFQTVQFSATVTGTSNQAVTWGLGCTATATTVSACGTISSSGTYISPNTVPTVATADSTDPAVVTVTAISQAQSSAGASVQFNVASLNQQPLAAPVQLGSREATPMPSAPIPIPARAALWAHWSPAPPRSTFCRTITCWG